MKSSSILGSPKLRKFGVIFGAVLLVVIALLGAGYWLVVPGMANTLVRDKLESAEAKLGLTFEIDKVSTHGVSAVSLEGFSVLNPADKTPVFKAESISASIDAMSILVGDRKLSGVKIQGSTLYVHRNADGTTNLETIIAEARSKRQGKDKDPASPEPAVKDGADSKLDAALSSFLRFFGDRWPDITVQNARVALSAAEGAAPWEVDAITSEELRLNSGGQSAEFTGVLKLTRGEGSPRWTLPETVTLQANLQRPLLKSTGSIALSPAAEIQGVGPYPFLRLGVAEVALTEANTVSLRGLSLGVQGDSTPTKVAEIDSVSASFEKLSFSPLELRALEIQVDKPTLFVDHDAQFGNVLEELNQLLRAPHARHIVGVAKSMADEIAIAQGREPEKDEGPDKGGLRKLLAGINWTKFLANKAPQSVKINDAAVHMTDARALPLLTSDPKIALQNGTFEFSHRIINGALQFKGGFDAVANGDDPRGSATIDLEWSYRSKALKVDAQLDALSVPWLVQLTSASVADNLRSGVVRADFKAERPANSSRLGFNGLVSLENTTIFLAPLAEEPVENLSASYNFEGSFDAKAAIPAPKMLKATNTAEDANAQAENQLNAALANSTPGQNDPTPADAKDPSLQPPKRGALVFSKGHFEVNGVPGEFRPAIYGFYGLQKRPTRFDAEIDLPSIPVDKLFKAVPDAIKGPLTGTKMRGDFAWKLALEIPLYHAGDMKWDAKPELRGFELISMPDAVDVRKLRDQFEMTIYDPTIKWSRKVTIPKMRPVPLDWLVEHSGIEIERFEQRRRNRQWPPQYAAGFVPAPDKSNFMQPHPSPWASEDAAAQRAADAAAAAAARESATQTSRLNSFFGLEDANENAPDAGVDPAPQAQPAPRPTPPPTAAPKSARKYYISLAGEQKEHPYGPYEFIPLQYISPWMLRAAITTEDNSFFKHGGFNWLAIRNSVEANIEAGRYVRGASTISMQLIKNIYLTRDKVLVRKLREVFLVWLMEDVVDIPKARILELYFNIIEYGPGIFGVHDAAIHYFGKRADKLSLTEVAWLVSIVPNPKKFHFYYERGEISPSWFNRMLRYVRVMANRERATEADYEAAKLDKPTFYKPKNGEPMMRVERAPEEVNELIYETESIEIPSLQNLFGP
ncbi:transglycosylase domain-containing protein [Bradymonas sediminis]|uniref:Uncharacterized protein n=1 Tax=Bradymonas sediminis TaxID=1548548 RepID=A0A2Z4FKT0_9DELT|nr:transglycosylase domain-containing protein [Bradymonas sediminis]AWV89502.1 hypothetical protein DN745_09175 [Bradymonas sediminis]TDP76770.1 transglycosylase [Bradymonas sediminis]